MRNNIAFDLDGVLVDILPVLDTVLQEMCGAKLPENMTEFKIKIPGLSGNEVQGCINEALSRVTEIKINPMADVLFKELYKITGEPVLIITARPKWLASQTYLLIDRMTKVPIRLSMVTGWPEKLAHLGPIEYFVEDRRRTALNLVQNRRRCFLIDKSYNQCPKQERLIRLKDIGDLLGLIDLLTFDDDLGRSAA